MISMRVILFEDDPNVRHVMEKVLQPLCSRFVGVESIADGRARIAAEEFDVILLDLRLTDSDKKETLSAIHQLRQSSNAPLIVMSGLTDENLKQDALDAGADAFVAKSALFSNKAAALLLAVHAAILKHPKKHPNDSYLDHVTLLEKLVHAA